MKAITLIIRMIATRPIIAVQKTDKAVGIQPKSKCQTWERVAKKELTESPRVPNNHNKARCNKETNRKVNKGNNGKRKGCVEAEPGVNGADKRLNQSESPPKAA